MFIPRSIDYIYKNIKNFLCFYIDNIIKGCGELNIYSKEVVELRIYVDINFRNIGIGSEILKFLIFEAKELKADSIFVLTRYKDFFMKRGFRLISKKEFPKIIYKDCLDCILYPEECVEYLLELRFKDDIKFVDYGEYVIPADP
ncbi:MAG: GNAT family N-acetyltransferase [bacterium]|nr:GNAT family N-acetyltransferase [bacterium]